MSRNLKNTRISKGGKLIADEWIWNEDFQSGENKIGVDITKHTIYHMGDVCAAEDITLKDILLLIENIDIYSTLSPMFTKGPWLKEMIAEGLSGKKKELHMDSIRLSWVYSINNDFYNEGKDILESYISVSGIVDNENESYALEFTPLYELANCKIILDEELIICDERKESLKKRREYLDSLSEEEYEQETYYPTLLQTRKHFTLYDILHGLFWELSYLGSPIDRDEKLNDLKETARKIDSGEENLKR